MKAADHKLASILYELTTHFVELRYFLELAWYDEDVEPEDALALQRCGVLFGSLQSQIDQLSELLDNSSSKRFNQFMEEVSSFWKLFQKEWCSNERRDCLHKVAGYDPEFAFSVVEYLLEHSPLRPAWWAALGTTSKEVPQPSGNMPPQWTQIEQTFDRANESLGDALPRCADIARSLHELLFEPHGKLFPAGTVPGERGALLSQVASEINEDLDGLAKVFPFLRDFKLDSTYLDLRSLAVDAKQLECSILERLAEPSPVCGPLGIVLHSERFTASRNGKTTSSLIRRRHLHENKTADMMTEVERATDRADLLVVLAEHMGAATTGNPEAASQDALLSLRDDSVALEDFLLDLLADLQQLAEAADLDWDALSEQASRFADYDRSAGREVESHG